MIFFDIKIILDAINEADQKKKEEVDREVYRLKDNPDEELLKLYVKGSFVKKVAAARILKERGYNPQQLAEEIKMIAELKKEAEELERLSKEFDKFAKG